MPFCIAATLRKLMNEPSMSHSPAWVRIAFALRSRTPRSGSRAGWLACCSPSSESSRHIESQAMLQLFDSNVPTVPPMTAPRPGSTRLEDLLGQIASTKDQAAFAELYSATKGKLFSAIVRIVRRGDIAEEVIQDAYVRIWR